MQGLARQQKERRGANSDSRLWGGLSSNIGVACLVATPYFDNASLCSK
jgi:hypothetical protein